MPVVKRPRIGIIACGDEVVEPGRQLPEGKLYASNLLTLDYGIRRGNMERVLDGDGKVLEVKQDVGPKIQSGDVVAIPTVGAGYLTGCFTYVVD